MAVDATQRPDGSLWQFMALTYLTAVAGSSCREMAVLCKAASGLPQALASSPRQPASRPGAGRAAPQEAFSGSWWQPASCPGVGKQQLVAVGGR